MERVIFFSCKPYLYVNLHRERGISVTFNKNGCYTATNPIELQLLREYAEKTKGSYLITEAGGELEQEDLIRLHEKYEDKLIEELEQRQAERAKEEEKRKEWHDIYSILRGSDQVYR